EPLVYWVRRLAPRDGVHLGIGFSVDEASAWVAAFIGLLYALTFVFAWGFFDRTHGHFHILMLLFLAAMVGFCFTRDMFNLFVWFEVMSVAAFALTAYHLAESSLAGAINFTVVNSLAGFLMLGGIGLIYAQTGTLDFEGIAAAVARGGRDPVVAGAFCLVAAALMIKGAIVPFQFWLADAHAVAPSPVSVIFSGSMVSLGLFGLAKVSSVVFGGSDQVQHALPALLIGLGSFTALLGGWMALLQRHLKRMLAFSTISHAGIMLTGLGALTVDGTGGMLVYVVGHGLVKGALFMIAGILLATQASIDEIALRGLGRGIWPAGVAMALAGLLLCGLPLGVLDQGTRLVQGALAQQGHG
ncbi:NADH-quinone oxidoreductase subunit E, partial [Methylobacterium radiotolerans]